MPESSLTYRVAGPLAQGGMANLYRIYLSDGTPAVLREMHKSKLLHFWLRKRFKSGATIRKRLSPHPGIVNSLETGSHFFFSPYEIIEMVDGVTLRSLINTGDHTLKSHLPQVLHDMAESLAWVHENGLMHLDVKPENFLLRRRGDSFLVKLTDFDMAREMHDNGPRKLYGTPAFMAPEQFRHKLSYQASDVFSFGLIAYQLLTGKHPFAGKTPKKTWRHQASHHIQPKPIWEMVPGVDPQLEFVIMKCLKKSMKERYTDMKQVLQALKASSN